MPKLAAFVDSLDTVEEPFRSAYVPDGARFKLDADGVEDVTGLRNAHEAQKKATRDAKAELEEMRRQIAEREQREEANKAGISDDVLTGIRAAEEEKRKPLETEIGTLRSEVRELRIEGPVQKALLAAGMYEDDWDLAKTAILTGFDLSDKKKLVVLDGDGNPTTKTLDEFVAAYRTKHPRRFAADVGSGGGAARSAVGGGVGASKQADITRREVSVGL